tara:strand:- start:41 stop:1006 length:966 start_codon:yes stop_codon:yes gene_type:complete
MKTFQQFQSYSQHLDEGINLASKVYKVYKTARKTPIIKKVGNVIKNLRTKSKLNPNDYKIMYHGTNQKDASKIVRKGFRGRRGAGEGGLPLDDKKRRVYVTDDPQKALEYAKTKTKYDSNLSPSVVGVRVPTKDVQRAYRDGEYIAPVKGMKSYQKDVKPIKIRNSKVVQEGKGDAIKAATMLGKKVKQISPKLMAKTKEFLRNQRSGLGTTARRSQNQLKSIDMKDAKKILQNPKKFGEDDIKFAKEISSQGKKSLMPGEKIQKADKISKLTSNRKSIHPPTADAAQAKLTDRKVELIKNRNNRRREKERLLRRMFEKGK